MQELASEVPQGATPRSLSVTLRGELTRSLAPGAAVTVAGVFLPEPFTGFRAMRAGLLTNTYLEAQAVSHMKASYHQVAQDAALQARILVRGLHSAPAPPSPLLSRHQLDPLHQLQYPLDPCMPSAMASVHGRSPPIWALCIVSQPHLPHFWAQASSRLLYIACNAR